MRELTDRVDAGQADQQGNIDQVLFSTQKGKVESGKDSPKKRGEIEKVHPKSDNGRFSDLPDFGPQKAKKRFHPHKTLFNRAHASFISRA